MLWQYVKHAYGFQCVASREGIVVNGANIFLYRDDAQDGIACKNVGRKPVDRAIVQIGGNRQFFASEPFCGQSRQDGGAVLDFPGEAVGIRV